MESRNEAIHQTGAAPTSSAPSASLLIPSTLFGLSSIPQDIFDQLALFAYPETLEGNNDFVSHALVNPELASRYKKRLLNILLTHVIKGKQAEAKKIIQHYPQLLLETSIIVDYSGRQIEGTALQLALGAEDVQYHADEECMVEMIHNYLRQLPAGEKCIAEQTAKQFPEGWELEENQRVMRDKKMLSKVINTIRFAKNKVHLNKAIKQLQDYLISENKNKTFRTGKHFNSVLLTEAYALYSNNYKPFGDFHSDKNLAVWNRVIGTINRYVPANMAQALCTGIGSIVDTGCRLERTLSIYDHNVEQHVSYFPLDSNPNAILGQHCAITSYQKGAATNWVPGTTTHDCLTVLCDKKGKTVSRYIQACVDRHCDSERRLGFAF